MFTKEELAIIRNGLVMQIKSVNRLAAKDEQPESVAAEYRKVAGEVAKVLQKCNVEMDKLVVGKK